MGHELTSVTPEELENSLGDSDSRSTSDVVGQRSKLVVVHAACCQPGFQRTESEDLHGVRAYLVTIYERLGSSGVSETIETKRQQV